MENRAREDARAVPGFPGNALAPLAPAAQHPLSHTAHPLAPSSSWKLPELELNSRGGEISR